jgi:hypothetical protein
LANKEIKEQHNHRGGKQFLMIKEAQTTDAEVPPNINIVLNWFEELKQRVKAN